MVRALSERKASAVAAVRGNADEVVIGADTVVYLDKLYGKPHDRADAIGMLSELNGREHFVFTGVTVIACGRKVTFSVRSAVTFRSMTAEEIENYVDTHRPFDKAGGYAIQEGVVVQYAIQEGVVVQSYKGSLTNIIGLPMEKLTKVLKEVQKWRR